MRFANTQTIQKKTTLCYHCNFKWLVLHIGGCLIVKTFYLAFIELLSAFFGTGPVLTGGHMALQCAVPRKSLMTIRTFIRFFTYSEPNMNFIRCAESSDI